MQLFYEPDILTLSYLNDTESRHCIKVLRKKVGDQIHIIDGKGNLVTAKISEANHKKCGVEIVDIQSEFEKRNFTIHLAIAPTKNNDRTEWCVEKCIELGVDEISFIKCINSERTVVKPERIEKVAISAIKQSLKAYIPRINMLQNFDDFVKGCSNKTKCIAHLDNEQKITLSSLDEKLKDDVCILIGPEGDFDSKEIKLAYENGFQPTSLGNSRLRTETAGVAAICELNIQNRQ